MKVIGKSVASIQSSDGEKFGPNGGFTAVLSTASLDRDGDTLLKGEWMDLPEWLPLDIDHGRKAADTIGKFHPYWDGDVMMMDAYFASTEQAQTVRTLIKDLSEEDGSGCPLGVSVFFGQYKNRKSGEPQRELLNAGVVGIPANRDAVIVAAKSALAIKDMLDESDVETQGRIRDSIMETFGIAKGVGYIGQLGGIAAEGVLSALTDGRSEEAPLAGVVKAVDGNMALLQAIHDASCHLGAMCAVMEPDVDEASGASEGANKSADVAEKSVVTLEVEAETLETPTEIKKLTLDEFKAAAAVAASALMKTSTQEDSPADGEEPAPAVEAAAASDSDAAEPDVVDDAAFKSLKLRLSLSETL